MRQKFTAFPGMEDILPGEVERWQWLEQRARIFFESRGFREIRTPLLEPAELFARSIGEATDIVHKEMYSFEDRGGRKMSLRPEMTASVARAVIEKGLLKTAKSLRLYYLGPMFRAERPQAGRKRQFHQIGIEMINEAGLEADVEVIRLLYDFLKYTGVAEPLVQLNDLGNAQNRPKLAEDLRHYFDREKSKLCPDCHWRLEKNVFRIFDCKVESCQPVIQSAPWDEVHPLGEDFEKLTQMLNGQKIPFTVKRRLVRGLDYYDGVVFEAVSRSLGAQDAVAGGGRYNQLYAELGGQKTPCTGFSIGMERLLTVLENEMEPLSEKIRKRRVYLAPLDASDEILDIFRKKALELRELGIRTETLPGEFSLSRHLKRANQWNIRYVLMLGPDEIKKSKCTVKDLDEKQQFEIGLDELSSTMERVLRT
ncbi:MAG: histidine--tRNA ligase [Candidatus Omnitrophica bacterium]|nr:histidine--tRNA ligase [Candidatus Omnitrophota bacterium]